MGERLYVTWDRFTGGEWGNLGARQAGLAPKGMFHALNMVRYRTGFLGPRWGLRDMAFTGMPVGAVSGFGWAGTAGSDLWVAQGTALRLFNTGTPGSAAQAVSGTFAAAPTRQIQSVEGPLSRTYMANYGDKLYYLDHVAKTLWAIAGSPAAGCLCIYGDRMIAAGTPTNRRRLYYSDVDNFTSWPAVNFIDVGNVEIRAVFPQRGHLVIVGQDGQWWILTGVPGINDVLRRVQGPAHPWHFYASHAAALSSGEIACVPLSSSWPARFDGIRLREDRHLEFLANDEVTADSDLFVKVIRGFKSEEFVAFGGNPPAFDLRGQALLHRMDVSTFHDFDQATSAFAASDAQGNIYLSDGGAAGISPKVWAWSVENDRPAFTTDTYGRPVDGAATSQPQAYLHLPEWWEPQEREVLVRAVTVDFVKWNTGHSQTNHFDVVVDAIDRYANPGPTSSAVQSFDEAPSAASTEGTSERRVFNVGGQGSGTGMQVRLTSIRGCAVRRVAVEVEIEGRRAA